VWPGVKRSSVPGRMAWSPWMSTSHRNRGGRQTVGWAPELSLLGDSVPSEGEEGRRNWASRNLADCPSALRSRAAGSPLPTIGIAGN
jgi:hypothetical protein